jgi:hypothetical protein
VKIYDSTFLNNTALAIVSNSEKKTKKFPEISANSRRGTWNSIFRSAVLAPRHFKHAAVTQIARAVAVVVGR